MKPQYFPPTVTPVEIVRPDSEIISMLPYVKLLSEPAIVGGKLCAVAQVDNTLAVVELTAFRRETR